jgi:uncharacterized protein YxjI
MSTQQWTPPLLSMIATIIMCVLLSVCQSSNASNYHSQSTRSNSFSSNGHHIHIKNNNGQRTFEVDGKTFSFEQLSEKQKKQINKVEEKLNNLEISIEIESDEMEQWSNKMEVVAEKMQFEEIMHDFEVEEGIEDSKKFSQEMNRLSSELTKASQNLEIQMRTFEKKMHVLQADMPKINQQKLTSIENQSKKYEELLIEISDSLSE